MAKQKIKFLKSPTGAYGLAYSAGDQATIEAKQADILVKEKFAEKVKAKK